MDDLFQKVEYQKKINQNKKSLEADNSLKMAIDKEQKLKELRNMKFGPYKTGSENLLNLVANSLQEKKSIEKLKMCEEALGKELGENKTNLELDKKLKQYLWETAPELRELQQQLLVAKVAKEQALQLAEKDALKELKQKEKEYLAHLLQIEREKEIAEEQLKKETEHKLKQQYHKELDEQLHSLSAKDKIDEEQALKEREIIDEINKKIYEEERLMMMKKLQAQEELKQQALELQKIRDQLKQNAEIDEKAQEAKIDEYRKAQELRAKELDERKDLELKLKLELQEDLVKHLEKIYAEKEREELIRIELAIEEKDLAEQEKAKIEEMKKSQIHAELQDIYDIQIELKKHKEELRKKEEEEFRKITMLKLYEEDRLDMMSQHKRRLKQAEHRKIVQKMIEENQKKEEMERSKEMAYQLHLREMEKLRQQAVEEEKSRFLKNHAQDLIGYLPKKVFKDEKEIKQLGEEFKNFYFKKSNDKSF